MAFARGPPPSDIQPVDATPSETVPRELGPAGRGAVLAGVWIAALGAALAAVNYRAFDLDRFFVPKELALHTGALFIVVALKASGWRAATTRINVALALWLTLSLISAFAATSGGHAIRALELSFSAAVLYWGAATLRHSGRERAVVIALGAAATLAVGSALAQAYGLKLDLFAINRAPGGTLGNRNFIAHIAAMALPLLIWLSATARSNGRALIGAVAILMLAAALVLSRTRAAWLALAIWLVVTVPVVWMRRDVIVASLAPRRGWILGGALAAGVALALVVPNGLDWKSDSPYLDSVLGVVNYREGSGAGRLKQYENSLKIAQAHPLLGAGPGNWAAVYPAFASRNDPSILDQTGMTANPWPSSDWVAALAERGVPAAFALVAFVALLILAAWRSWRDDTLPARVRFGALCGGSVVLIGAIEGSFDAVILLAFPSVILLGAAAALVPANDHSTVRWIGARQRGYMTALAALIWIGMVAMSAGKLEAMRLYTKGTYDSIRDAAALDAGSYRIQMKAAELTAARGYCRLAYHNAMSAAALFPHSAAAQALVARCMNSDR